MSSISEYVAGNIVNRTGRFFAALLSPRVLRNSLVAALTILVLSQLLIFYVFVAARVNPADTWQEAFKALKCADCSFFRLWEMLISAVGLFMLDFKSVILVLSVFIWATGFLIIRIIPDEWYKIGDVLVILILLAAPLVIIGLAAVELLPYLLNNYL